MSSFKPKRVSGADLAAQLSSATASLPAAVPTPLHALAPSQDNGRQRPPPLPQRGDRLRVPPVVQVNFKASEAFADLIAREGGKAGSTRRFLARLMREAGFDVPEADVNPPDNRRRRSLDA